MTFSRLADAVLNGAGITDKDIQMIAHAKGDSVEELCAQASRIREHFFGKTVSLCSIINAKSGTCSEDCAFCAQSGHYQTSSPKYAFLDEEQILTAARAMKEAGAARFAVVTSGKGLTDADFEKLLSVIGKIRAMGLLADASVGLLTPERVSALRDAGLCAYHHNLETSRSFFPQICTTHSYDDDVNTVRAAVDAGLYVCSGGLFGLGESWEQRAELARTLAELKVQSVPVNFLSPIPGTPMQTRPIMSAEEACKIIALLRFMLPEKHIRICGGRPAVFGTDRVRPLLCGASGLMIGDYLTTKGNETDADLKDILALGLSPEQA